MGARRNPRETADDGDLFSPELSARIEVKSGHKKVGIMHGQLERYVNATGNERLRCIYSLCFYKAPRGNGEPRLLKDIDTDCGLQRFLARSLYAVYLIDASFLSPMCAARGVVERSGWKKGKTVSYLNSVFESTLKSDSATERSLAALALEPSRFERGHGICRMQFRGHSVHFVLHVLLPRECMWPLAALIERREAEGSFRLARDFRAKIMNTIKAPA